ncbi:hypothetical protein XENOCAPTIV_014036, partial [Xenoophorus captivus]
ALRCSAVLFDPRSFFAGKKSSPLSHALRTRARRRAETHTDREKEERTHSGATKWFICRHDTDPFRAEAGLFLAPLTLQRAVTMSQADVSTCSAPQRVFQEAVKKGNTKELHSLLQNMTNCEFNVNSFGPEGQTALHQSVIDGNLELVKLLVKFGADIRLANREGWSALHIAAFGGHQDIVLYLITKAKYSSGAR